jgi:hypothetical protein
MQELSSAGRFHCVPLNPLLMEKIAPASKAGALTCRNEKVIQTEKDGP